MVNVFDRNLVRAAGNAPAPQYFNPDTDSFEVIQGRDGANAFIEKGRVVKDVIISTNDEVRTYSTKMFGIGISNDGTSDITFEVNDFLVTIKPGEVFDDLFEPFTEIKINATSAFRAVIRE